MTPSWDMEDNRLVIVGPTNGLGRAVEDFSARNPGWNVVRTGSYLSGIAEVCRSPARAVLAMVEFSDAALTRAVAGLREAGGRDTRLVLCCGPESEPKVREALRSGADDYLISPVDVTELETAIGIAAAGDFDFVEHPGGTGVEELAGIVASMEALEARPKELFESLVELVRGAVGARGATLSVQGAGATAGEPVTRAVLSFPIESLDPPSLPFGKGAGEPEQPESKRAEVHGSLTVGEKEGGPYTPADIEKIAQYAKLIGSVLSTAARQRRWRELALTDTASGLPNRRFLHEQLPRILERAAAEHFAVTVLLFDVDNFKSFNDRHGHDAGDEILRVVGQLFRKVCREQDIVTRYGGDEFAVVFWDAAGPREPGSKHPQQALFVVDRFTEALRTQRFLRLGPDGGHVTISGGLATYPWDASTMDALITSADQALLSAKRAGKNRVVVVGG